MSHRGSRKVAEDWMRATSLWPNSETPKKEISRRWKKNSVKCPTLIWRSFQTRRSVESEIKSLRVKRQKKNTNESCPDHQNNSKFHLLIRDTAAIHNEGDAGCLMQNIVLYFIYPKIDRSSRVSMQLLPSATATWRCAARSGPDPRSAPSFGWSMPTERPWPRERSSTNSGRSSW